MKIMISHLNITTLRYNDQMDNWHCIVHALFPRACKKELLHGLWKFLFSFLSILSVHFFVRFSNLHKQIRVGGWFEKYWLCIPFSQPRCTYFLLKFVQIEGLVGGSVPICTSCNLDKPYAKTNHALSN